MVGLSEQQSFKESVIEILSIVKACLGSFWFWLPVGYAVLLFSQIMMFFFIHPLTILIMPAILVFYAIRQEKKRLRGQYGLVKDREILASDPIGISPHPKSSQWDATEAVEEYQAWLDADRKEKEDHS